MPTDLLITNVEQRQPDYLDGTEIILFGRKGGAPGERQKVVVRGFTPHFYAPAEAVREREQELLSMDCISGLGDEVVESLTGEETIRVETPYPQDTPTAREQFDTTWEADVPFTNRFRVDAGIFAYVQVPDAAFDGETATVHWRELDPLEEGSGPTRVGVGGGE